MQEKWREIKGNDGFPAETQNVKVKLNGVVLDARFMAPFCEFITRSFPTHVLSGVTHWMPLEK